MRSVDNMTLEQAIAHQKVLQICDDCEHIRSNREATKAKIKALELEQETNEINRSGAT